ncbi:hypothetical protein [Tuwongella immobilis]|uniref:Uncharacterized protein n=1 Tax=Tuwongella immobilis TaxID=692036 RepID=A0A6C2YH72_9BACT|nr:hypothetical protein [Tuwongella immobilis]VIP00704.1 Uncharacterized protein OS=Microcoleus sp. PCC 7113 GN=Mic7113_4619 PE=4 SV=1 [Tuwongella immobilis]VTR96826.1 Uncharacterized protein OS=Microcoleus sp. PCC 7113 GN=Mic7113_4619 PE=4 SV=1 [Tuwongella immobilis]
MAIPKKAILSARPQLRADSSTYGSWNRFLKSLDLDTQPDRDAPILHRALCRLANHPQDIHHVLTILDVIRRAVPLVQSALRWESPIAGGNPDSPTETDRARGGQWRLTMLYAGVELLIRGVLNLEQGYLRSDLLRQLTNQLRLPPCPLVAPPKLTPKLDERWMTIASEGGDPPLFQFLKLNDTGVRLFRAWLVEKQPITNWVDLVQLAATIRHLTAHGALSASKVIQMKLDDTIEQLIDGLACVVEAVLMRIMEPDV